MTTATSPYLNKSHRELYPSQYRHRLVGQHVAVKIDGNVRIAGIVERVMQTRFGALAIIIGDRPGRAWAVKDCHPQQPKETNR